LTYFKDYVHFINTLKEALFHERDHGYKKGSILESILNFDEAVSKSPLYSRMRATEEGLQNHHLVRLNVVYHMARLGILKRMLLQYAKLGNPNNDQEFLLVVHASRKSTKALSEMARVIAASPTYFRSENHLDAKKIFHTAGLFLIVIGHMMGENLGTFLENLIQGLRTLNPAYDPALLLQSSPEEAYERLSLEA